MSTTELNREVPGTIEPAGAERQTGKAVRVKLLGKGESSTSTTRQEGLSLADNLVDAAKHLRDGVSQLRFSDPVAYVYNPLDYAWAAHELYLRRYANNQKRVLFLGMNPGPFGMVQTGVPFGQVAAVRDWLQVITPIKTPRQQHPKRLVSGFECQRSEISGERLWGLFAKRFGSAEKFFAEHFVVNYCPLAFVESSGRNRTPDKLTREERNALFSVCDRHLSGVIETLKPEWLIGVGDFAARRAEEVCANKAVRVGRILHPSPACPASNNNWAAKVTTQLQQLGVWL
ncbi:MAG: uracil-DNA glycosylase family protein [Chthoniobacterales bacterium]